VPHLVADFWRQFRAIRRGPITRRHRIIGAVVGALGGFWIGCICRLIVGPLPIHWTVALGWSLLGALVAAVLGTLFPKVIFCVCFPFAVLPGLLGDS
jgi:hypothetical protein